MKKKRLIMLGTSIFFLTVFLLSCQQPMNPEPDVTDQEEVAEPENVTRGPALRAVPVASGSKPVVLGLSMDGTKNYYLLDIGFVRNMYVSTIAEAHYDGMIPIPISQTSTTQSTITQGLTEMVSESITTSGTQSSTVGLEFA